MNDYRPDVPRAAFALGAAALTAITLGVLVAAPAVFDAGFEPATTLAVAAPQPVEVAILPARIDVIAVREPNVAWAMPQESAKPNCKPEV